MDGFLLKLKYKERENITHFNLTIRMEYCEIIPIHLIIFHLFIHSVIIFLKEIQYLFTDN